MFMCCTKYSSVMYLIYSGQLLFSYKNAFDSDKHSSVSLTFAVKSWCRLDQSDVSYGKKDL
jgi:hypothetical protein